MQNLRFLLVAGAVAASSIAGSASADQEVSQTNLVSNLVSDGGVPAVINDKGFINPWGISEGSHESVLGFRQR